MRKKMKIKTFVQILWFTSTASSSIYMRDFVYHETIHFHNFDKSGYLPDLYIGSV